MKCARHSSLKEGISKFCIKNGYSEEVAAFLFNKYSHDLVHANSIDRWCAIFLLTVIGIHDVDLVLDDRGDGSGIGNAVHGNLFESEYDKYFRKPVEDFIQEEVKKLIDSEFLCKTQEQSKASTLNTGDEVPLINNRDMFIQDSNILIRKLRHVFYIKGVTKSSLKAALDAHCVKMHYDEVVAKHLLQMYSHNIVHGDWKETSTGIYYIFVTLLSIIGVTDVDRVLEDSGDGVKITEAVFGRTVAIPEDILEIILDLAAVGLDECKRLFHIATMGKDLGSITKESIDIAKRLLQESRS